MNYSDISWYSINENLKTKENGVVSFGEAVKIIDRYFANLKPFYETGEEALAETMFGFSRTSKTFVEICIHSLSEIAFKFEMSNSNTPWYLKIFVGIKQYEETLKSREALIGRVEKFFSNTPEDYYQLLTNGRV